jgi:hypothetical protein
MSHRKKIKIHDNFVEPRFANWLAQLSNMISTRYFYIVAGRGSSKTTEFQVERLMDMCYDMPGAPVCWVSDTYSNLQQNILPTVLEGLQRKGWREGIHYVIEKKPPVFTNKEKENLPDWLIENFWNPHNIIASYKHTMIFFTGLNITFGSLDRPSTLAGRSYVHIFGDEAKFFKEEKLAKLTKAVRGYRTKFGNSVYYTGHTFTTDMPNISNVGEHDWILKQSKKLNPKSIMLLLRTAFILNEAVQEWIEAKKTNDVNIINSKFNIVTRWEQRLYTLRLLPEFSTFYYVASSYINVDILTPDYFKAEFETDLSDVNTALLSMLPTIKEGDRFYAALGEHHFFEDGNDTYLSGSLGLFDSEDCKILKYLNTNAAIDAGVDFGNMMSMLIGQFKSNTDYYILKDLHTLTPEWIQELANKFIKYFEPHKHKVLNLYYDRAGNNYKKANQDLASKLKANIEKTPGNKKTGWNVILRSVGQGNIDQHEEYLFMMELLSNRNKHLPKIHIDMFNCKYLKASLELTPTKINTKGFIVKQKSSEKLPIHRLPLESTNFSDAFKYLMMRSSYRKLSKTTKSQSPGTVSTR